MHSKLDRTLSHVAFDPALTADRLYDHCADEGTPWIAFEHLPG